MALGMALLTLAIVGAHSVATYSVTHRQEEDSIGRIVDEELEYLITQYRRDLSIPPLPHHPDLSVYVAPTAAARAALPAPLRELSIGLHDEVRIGGAAFHVGVRALGETRFYLVYDIAYHEARMRKFRWLLVLGVAATAALSATLGYWLAGWLTRPVRELAERVARLGLARTEAPLAPDYTEEELYRLAQAFDGYHRRVADLLDREREFTANVSHEFRTPLTSIQTSCELLLQEPGLSAAARQRFEAIRRASVRLTETLRALLFLARDTAATVEELALHECVDEALEPLQGLLCDRPIALENAVPARATLHADHSAVRLVVDNLVRNAIEHTDRGVIRVTYTDGTLVVADSGRGIAPEDLPRIFQRFYRSTGRPGEAGRGLGLAIVKRLCDRYGWEIAVDSARGAGTRVRVTLVPSQGLHGGQTGS